MRQDESSTEEVLQAALQFTAAALAWVAFGVSVAVFAALFSLSL